MEAMPRNRVGSKKVVVAGLAVAALVAGCSAAPEPELRAGQLLTARPLTTAAAVPGAETRLITYVSDDADGQPIVVSGTVAVPTSSPPEGGWPVISWAHGTTGYADTCAPSVDTTDGLAHDYLGPVTTMLGTWVARGYAVVQTDYQGLGTPGGHPYTDGTSEAHTVTDIVRAARELDPGIGTKWVVAGHSQGGQAALFTAQDAPQRAPELDLLGAVAMAPGGVGMDQAVDLVRAGKPEVDAAQAFLPLLVLGAAVVDPSVNPDEIFTADAHPLLGTARTECIAQIRRVPTVGSARMFTPEANLDALRDYLRRQDPIALTPRVPVMIAQGSADTAVTQPGVDALAKALCGKDVAVDYRVYAGLDHRGVINASLSDTQAFVDTVTAGKTGDTCPR